MESAEAEMIVIVHQHGGWYLYEMNTKEIIPFRYETHQDAEEGAKTRAWRIDRGWAP